MVLHPRRGKRRAVPLARALGAALWAGLGCAGPPPAGPAAPPPATSPELEAPARRLEGAPGVRLERQTDRIVLFLPVDALFEHGTADLSPGAAEPLDAVVGAARAVAGASVAVRGYTDAQGSESLNLTLSEDRAAAVRAALVSGGLPADRISAEGFGAQFPIAGNETPEGRALNRRIEIELRTSPEPESGPAATDAAAPMVSRP